MSKAIIRYSRRPDQANEEVVLAKGSDFSLLQAIWSVGLMETIRV